METEASIFRGNYPLGGERIGPGWRAIWRALPERGWIEAAPFAVHLAEQTGLSPDTVANLLRQAGGAGILEKRYRDARSRRRAFYRVALKNPVA